ncbi:MAG: Na(+)/H(+) antiporter subunit B [Bacillota bacterium]
MSEALLLLLLGFLVLSAVATVALEDILSSIIAFSVFGVLLSIIFVVFQAPDVALAQAVIGSGLITAMFVVTLSKVRERKPDTDGDAP